MQINPTYSSYPSHRSGGVRLLMPPKPAVRDLYGLLNCQSNEKPEETEVLRHALSEPQRLIRNEPPHSEACEREVHEIAKLAVIGPPRRTPRSEKYPTVHELSLPKSATNLHRITKSGALIAVSAFITLSGLSGFLVDGSLNLEAFLDFLTKAVGNMDYRSGLRAEMPVGYFRNVKLLTWDDRGDGPGHTAKVRFKRDVEIELILRGNTPLCPDGGSYSPTGPQNAPRRSASNNPHAGLPSASPVLPPPSTTGSVPNPGDSLPPSSPPDYSAIFGTTANPPSDQPPSYDSHTNTP